MKKLLVVIFACSLSAQAAEPRWTFAVAAGAAMAASSYDSWLTDHRAHGCTEANSYLGPNPSTGKVYGTNLAITGATIGIGYLFKRWHIPIAPYAMMGVDTYRHAHGVHSWYTFKNGGCL